MKKGTSKYKVSPNGKRRLDFQQKLKKPSVKLPLIGKTVYLDVKEVKHQKRLQADLKRLGATIEEFVSKDINYFITTQSRPRSSKNVGDTSPAPSPFNCDPSPSPGTMDEQRVPTVTRGKALAQRARVNSRETNSLLDNAEKWGVKIVPLETAYKWIDKELKKLPKSVHNSEKVPRYPPSVSSYKLLKAPFVKFESTNLFYKPVTQILQEWPVMNVSTTRGSCPFDGFLLRGDDKSKEERGEILAAQVDIPTDDTPQEEKDGMDSNTPKPAPTEKATKKSETDGLSNCKVLTVGELRRKKEQKRRQERKKGYCECCKTKYENLDKHVREERHRLYVKDKSHYQQLDSLIGSVQSTAVFLKRCILASVTQASQTDSNSMSCAARKSPRKAKPSNIPKASKHETSKNDKAGIETAQSNQKVQDHQESHPQNQGATKSSIPINGYVLYDLTNDQSEMKENNCVELRKSPRKTSMTISNDEMKSPRKASVSLKQSGIEIESVSKESKCVDYRSPHKLSVKLSPDSDTCGSPRKSHGERFKTTEHLDIDRLKSPRKLSRSVEQSINAAKMKSPIKAPTALSQSPFRPLGIVRQSPRKTSNPFKATNLGGVDTVSTTKSITKESAMLGKIKSDTLTSDNVQQKRSSIETGKDISISSKVLSSHSVNENSDLSVASDVKSINEEDKGESVSKQTPDIQDQQCVSESESATKVTTEIGHARSGRSSVVKSEAIVVHKEMESLLSYGKERASRLGSSDDFEVSIVRSLGDACLSIKDKALIEGTDADQSDKCEDLHGDNPNDNDEGDVEMRDVDGENDEESVVSGKETKTKEYVHQQNDSNHRRKLRQSPRKRQSRRASRAETDHPTQIATISSAAHKQIEQGVDEKSSSFSAAVGNSYDRLTSDIPSDFQCYGPQGEFYMFSKTLAERIKERGNRRGTVENYNINMISQNVMRARSDSFSSTISGVSVRPNKPFNVPTRKSPDQSKKLTSSAMVASKRICNKYRNKRNMNTDHGERQATLSGYQGDDERDPKQVSGKAKAAQIMRGQRKKFWYYQVEPDGNTTTCEDKKLKALPKMVQLLKTAWNDVTVSSDHDSTRKTRRSITGVSSYDLDCGNGTGKSATRRVSETEDKYENNRSNPNKNNSRKSLSRRTSAKGYVSKSVNRKEILHRNNAQKYFKKSENVNYNDSEDSDISNKVRTRSSLMSQTSDGLSSVRARSRISYKAYFHDAFSSDSELSNLSDYKMPEDRINNETRELVSENEQNKADGKESDNLQAKNEMDGKDSGLQAKEIQLNHRVYRHYVVKRVGEDEKMDENIPKELKLLKSTWNNLKDVKTGRRSRTCSIDAKKERVKRFSSIIDKESCSKLNTDSEDERSCITVNEEISCNENDNKHKRQKKRVFWEYVPIISPEKNIQEIKSGVGATRELQYLGIKNIVRERRRYIESFSNDVKLGTSKGDKVLIKAGLPMSDKGALDLNSPMLYADDDDNSKLSIKSKSSRKSNPIHVLENEKKVKKSEKDGINVSIEGINNAETDNIDEEKTLKGTPHMEEDKLSHNDEKQRKRNQQKKVTKQKRFWEYIPIPSPVKSKTPIKHGKKLSKEALSLKDSWNDLSESNSRLARRKQSIANSSMVRVWQESGKKLRNISLSSRAKGFERDDNSSIVQQDNQESDKNVGLPVDTIQKSTYKGDKISNMCVDSGEENSAIGEISETVHISSELNDNVLDCHLKTPVKDIPMASVSPRQSGLYIDSATNSSDSRVIQSPQTVSFKTNEQIVKGLNSDNKLGSASNGLQPQIIESKKQIPADAGSLSPVFKRSLVLKPKSPVFKSTNNRWSTQTCDANDKKSPKDKKKQRISNSIREGLRVQSEFSLSNSKPVTVSDVGKFSSPEKSSEISILSSPQSGYSATPREKRRRQWKRKACDSGLDSSRTRSPLKKPQMKRRKLDKLKYVIDKENEGVSPFKKSNQSPRKSLFGQEVKTSNKQLNAIPCETKQNNEDSFSLKWQPVTLSEDTKKVKLNKSWTLISDRSASKLLTSEDDKDSFNGFTEDEANQNNSSLPSDLSYEEHMEVEIHSSEHEWAVEDEQSDDNNDEEFSKLVPSFSSPGKPSEPDWELNIDSFMKNRVNDKNMSLTSPWRSPRSVGKRRDIDASTTEKVSPVKYKRQSFLNRLSEVDSGTNSSKPAREKVDDEIEFNHRSPQKFRCDLRKSETNVDHQDREKVDEEIEFNHKSPQKFRCDFSPLRAENGMILGQIKKNFTSTPASSGLKKKKKSDRKFDGLVFSFNDEVDSDAKSSIQSPKAEYRILKKKSDVKKSFNIKYDASPQKSTKKSKKAQP